MDTLDPLFLRQTSPFGEFTPFLFLGLGGAQSRRGLSGARHADGRRRDHAARRRGAVVDARSRRRPAARRGDRRALLLRRSRLLQRDRRADGTRHHSRRGRRLFLLADFRPRRRRAALANGRAGISKDESDADTPQRACAPSLAAARRASDGADGRSFPSSPAFRFSAISCGRSAATASPSRPSSGPTATPMSISRVRPTAAASRRRRLIFVNGLGFEGWLDRLVTAAKSKGEVFTLGKGVTRAKGRGGTRSARLAGRRQRKDLCRRRSGTR